MKLRNLILSLTLAAGIFGFASASKAQTITGHTPIFVTFLNVTASGNSFIYNYSIAASTVSPSDNFIGANSSFFYSNLGGVTDVYETGYTATTSPDFYNFGIGSGSSLGKKATFNFNQFVDGTAGSIYYISVVSTQPKGDNTGLYATQNQDDGSQVQGGLISAPLPISVPEPSTVAMSFVLGAGIVIFIFRRRQTA